MKEHKLFIVNLTQNKKQKGQCLKGNYSLDKTPGMWTFLTQTFSVRFQIQRLSVKNWCKHSQLGCLSKLKLIPEPVEVFWVLKKAEKAREGREITEKNQGEWSQEKLQRPERSHKWWRPGTEEGMERVTEIEEKDNRGAEVAWREQGGQSNHRRDVEGRESTKKTKLNAEIMEEEGVKLCTEQSVWRRRGKKHTLKNG